MSDQFNNPMETIDNCTGCQEECGFCAIFYAVNEFEVDTFEFSCTECLLPTDEELMAWATTFDEDENSPVERFIKLLHNQP